MKRGKRCEQCGLGMKQVIRGGFVTSYCPECAIVTINGNDQTPLPDTHKPCPIWSCLYYGREGCFNVKWGSRLGPMLSRETAVALSFRYLQKNEHKVLGISSIRPGPPSLHGW